MNILWIPIHIFSALNRCLRFLIRGVRKTGVDDGVVIYVDQDKGRERLGRDLASWQEHRLRTRETPHLDRDRPIIIHYAPSFSHLPLQAADILAHSAFQQLRDFVEAGKWLDEPPFLTALWEAQVPCGVQMFHDRELFEIEAKARLVHD